MAGAERELRQKERGRNSNSDIELNKYKLRQETKNKNFEWHGQWHLTIFGEPLLRFRLSLDVMENDERQKGKAKRYGSYFPKTYKIAEGEKSIYMKKVLKKIIRPKRKYMSWDTEDERKGHGLWSHLGPILTLKVSKSCTAQRIYLS